MAFLRVEKRKNGTYLRIVEGYRDDAGKSRHRTLFSLGKLSQYSPESLKRMGKRLYELGGGDLKELVGGNVKELGRYNYGFYQVYYRIFCSFKLDQVLNRISRSRKLEMNFEASVMLMLLERLHDPVSKYSNHQNQVDYLGLPQVDLHHLYRSLDYLGKHNELIQSFIYQKGRHLFNQKIDMVFYDVTTFYFDSSVVEEGSIRQKGYGKDGKIGKTQVVFGMMVDQDKRPIGYRLYSGNTWEGGTFKDATLKLKREYHIDRMIMVADGGMMTRENLELLTSSTVDYEFIIGERLKSLAQKHQNHLLDLKNYQLEVTGEEFDGEPVVIRCCVLEIESKSKGKTIRKTVIGTYSKKRAKKDRIERERKVEKAKKMLSNPDQLRKKPRAYFIKTLDKQKYVLDQEKIDKAQKYDGFLAISTNAEGLSTTEVLDRYHDLFKIEHSFRTFKSYLEARPMFHWTNKRIEGHICLCYMAYALLNDLQLTLRKAGQKLSETKIRKVLSGMQLSLLEQKGEHYYLRSALKEDTSKLLRILGIKTIPDLIPKSNITNHL